MFVRSSLDEAGLTQAEFRVLGHIYRRAGTKNGAYPGIDSIAKTCLMSRTTVVKAIRGLEARRMISADRKYGRTSVYFPLLESQWAPKPDQIRARSRSDKSTPPDHFSARRRIKLEHVKKKEKDIHKRTPYKEEHVERFDPEGVIAF